MDCYYGSMHGFGFGFMWIIPVLFLALVFLVVARASGWFARGGAHRPHPGTGREILDRRYASGEITKEQYEQMKRDIAAT